MDFMNEYVAENQSRMEQDKENTQETPPVIKSLFKIGNPTTQTPIKHLNNAIEPLKERPVTTRKEAPDRSETGALAIQDSTPEATSLPDEKLLGPSPKSPIPRKQVIPTRNTFSTHVPQTPHFIKKRGRNHAQTAESLSQDEQLGEAAQHVSQDETQIETQILPIATSHEVQNTDHHVETIADSDTQILPIASPHDAQSPDSHVETMVDSDTQILPTASRGESSPPQPTTNLPNQPLTRRSLNLTNKQALLGALFFIIVILNASVTGFGQFFGPQGWGSAFNTNNAGSNLLKQVLDPHGLTPGATSHATPPTPMQIVNALLQNMTLDQKIGQMLMVRFNYPIYGVALNAMLTQYHVGSVIEYAGNIGSKSQLIELNKQIQQNAELPAIISVDQEGGTVDRLINLDGQQPSASTIGATGDPNRAYQQGLKDALALSGYGFNLNLAPVVDITNVYNPQLVDRTYGNNPTIVTEMAGAYLRGLQQSGKVLGVIKHFPGLGDTSTDPHLGLPILTRSQDNLNAIDWVPYKNLFSQKDVYAVMITHELVKALDTSVPSSLSPKVVSILRNQLGFQGVIITDGLTMDALMARYTLSQSAVMAIEAGDDLLMDPGSPNEVAQMIDGIKQALSSGAISQQRIDDSVRRILLLKYQMGLLNIHP